MNNKENINLIKGFKALRPIPEKAKEVIAPPYDVINSEEARILAENKPLSFLHISKPEIDLPKDTKFNDPLVYQKGSENLKRLIDDEILIEDKESTLYIYQIIIEDHIQTGVCSAASVEAYDNNLIKKHEHTQPLKEEDRIKNIDSLNAQTGPVLLTYPDDEIIDSLINDVTVKNEPIYDVLSENGSNHKIWIIENNNIRENILKGINSLDALFIADGHHRSAAASKVKASRQKANQNHNGNENYNYFLSVAFPASQMKILDYNRLVSSLNDHSVESILDQIGKCFDVKMNQEQVKPKHSKEFGIYIDGHWYQLNFKLETKTLGVVDSLDVSILHNYLLEPILGIKDERTDKRIDFVGGIRGLSELERRVDSGEMKIAFSFFPTSIQSLISVADADQVMPTKSTWFEPKLLDGLLTHRI
ncbi:DUF1015 family protein [Gammaproteobacteria bacterium]|nr:DUF1015 family protein [Gammaproteobacteria bacterium]